MRYSLICFLAVLFSCGALCAQDGPTPYPSKDDKAAWPGEGPIRVFKWMSDNRAAFWKRRDAEHGAVVFVGDSLTGGWKAPELKTFAPHRIANRGIGGDVSRGVLFRFKEDVLDLDPRAVVLCVGTNDLSAHGKPSIIVRNIAAILDQAREHNPKMPVVLCTVPPRANPKSPLKDPAELAELNRLIAKLADGREQVVLFDLFPILATADGAPDPACFREDLIHPSAEGYRRWAEKLASVLNQILASGEAHAAK